MKPPSQMSRTSIMVEGALMIALAFALSSIYHFEMPLGGSVTIFATLPIILMSLRHNVYWSFLTAGLYSVVQLFQGMKNLSYLHTWWGVLLCILLDYLIAYSCLGFTGPIARRFKNRTLGLTVGILATGLMRFICSFFSGLLIWPPDNGVSALRHSFLYNITWSGPDVAIVLVVALILSRVPVLNLLGEKPKAQPAGV